MKYLTGGVLALFGEIIAGKVSTHDNTWLIGIAMLFVGGVCVGIQGAQDAREYRERHPKQ